MRSDGTPGQGQILLREQGQEHTVDGPRQAQISDGQFIFFDVRPGEYSIADFSPRDETGVLFVTVSGENISDLVLTTAKAGWQGSDQARDRQGELTQKLTTVAGVVVDDRGAAVTGCAVAIFGEDPNLWTFDNQFSATVTTDWEGRFKITTLAPGSYFAAAVDELKGWDEYDRDFLSRLKARATRLTLVEGESKTLRLELTIF